MHFKWKYTPTSEAEESAAQTLAKKLNVAPVLARLLLRRGITTESAAKRFFRPQLTDLINPFLMKDMDLAVDRLNDAIGRKERILVYGDYDVDGCTAVALFAAGVRLLECADVHERRVYDRRVRQLAAVCLRSSSGGAYACALIHSAIQDLKGESL